MRPCFSPSARVALCAVALVAACAVPALAATRPAKPNRAAIATGPASEGSLPLLGEVLDIVAASRPDVTDPTRAAAAIRTALGEADRLGAIFAGDVLASEVRQLNEKAARERFACSEDLFAMLDSARALAAETEGAYDLTDAPLARVWSARDAPERSAVAEARAAVGWRMLLLEPERRVARFIKPGMAVTPGPVARGYVLDRVAETLRRRGVVRARLECGDAVLAFTPREPWIADITGSDGRPVLSLALSNAACATAASGDGAAGRPGDGAPAFDPRSGQPVRTRASVTVIAPEATRAGALAAALLVLGRDGAEAHARSHPGLGVVWIEPAGDFESVRVWAWNFSAIEPAPAVRVEWMTRP